MLRRILLFLLTIFSFFICEHILFIPFIVFCYLLSKHTKEEAAKHTSPLFLALAVYVAYFLSHHTHTNFTDGTGLFLDRILFISPQVFVHIINLILVPAHLSIDQGAMIKFAPELIHPYSIFCLLVVLCVIYTWISSFFTDKNVFVLLSGFLIALLPFLQIITPTYCLLSERYLYMPTFFLVLGLGYVLGEKRG